MPNIKKKPIARPHTSVLTAIAAVISVSGIPAPSLAGVNSNACEHSASEKLISNNCGGNAFAAAAPIPEPSTLPLLAMGIAGLIGVRRFTNRK